MGDFVRPMVTGFISTFVVVIDTHRVRLSVQMAG